jgi:hypothetical protein
MQIIFGATMLHILQDGIALSKNGQSTNLEPLQAGKALYSQTQTLDSISMHGVHIPDYWYKIIEEYVFMKWTERLDLFPGLSGIAALFQQDMNDQYVAGLWQKGLFCGLLWSTGTTTNSRSPSSLGKLIVMLNGNGLQIGPSWSWASRPDCFQFIISPRINTRCRVRSHLRPEFTLLSSTISVDGVNPLGRVQKATLKISGLVVRLRAGCLPNTEYRATHVNYTTAKGHNLFINPDWQLYGDRGSNRKNKHTVDDSKLQLLIISGCCSDWPTQTSEYSEHHQPVEEARIYGDWVTYKPYYRQSFFKDKESTFRAATDCPLCSQQGRRRDIWGLLIYPAKPEMTFFRVGVFFCRAERGGSDLLEEAEAQTVELY